MADRRTRWTKGLAATAVAATLASACGGGTDDLVAQGAVPSPSETPASEPSPPPARPLTPTVSEIAENPTPPSHDPVASGRAGDAAPVPPDGGAFVECSDVPLITATVPGDLGPTTLRWADPGADVLAAYMSDHPDDEASVWVDQTRGTVVAAFSARVAEHQDAIDALGLVTVVQAVEVAFSTQQLWATLDVVLQVPLSDRADAVQIRSLSVDSRRNRVQLGVLDPTEETFAALSEIVGTSALCLDVVRTPTRPEGPLEVIPASGVDRTTLVVCNWLPPTPYGTAVDAIPLAEVDHPTAEILRRGLSDPDGDVPAGDWQLWLISSDEAHYRSVERPRNGHARFERHGDDWHYLGATTGGRPCELRVALPDGLHPVEVLLDREATPEPSSTEIHLVVTEVGCAAGRDMGDDLLAPHVVETADAVLVAFGVVPPLDDECPSNPSARVTVELDAPLGDRVVLDGLAIPPSPIDPD